MATFNATITAGSDDAREDAGTVTLTGTNITIDTTTRYGGLRFLNVTIPQGSTINAATLTIELPSASFDDPDVTIWANDVDSASTFTTGANNISSRTPTTATVVWSASSIGTGVKVSPELKTIIQEIVNRAGWVSGNAIALILKGNSTSALRFDTYEDGAGANAELDIDYTAPSAGVPKHAMYYARMRG